MDISVGCEPSSPGASFCAALGAAPNKTAEALGSQPILMSTETVMLHLPSHALMEVNGIGWPRALGQPNQVQPLTAIKLEAKISVLPC